MLVSDILKLSIRTLSEKKLRAVLTIIGIAIGPMALMTIGGVTSGYGDFIVNSIMGLGQNLIVVTPSRDYKLTQDDLDTLKNIEGVVDASPFYSTQGEMYIGGEKKTVFIYGVNPDFLLKALTSLTVKEGRTPSESDLGRALVGYKIAYSDNGEPEYSVGDVVSVTVYQVKTGGKVEVKRLSVVVSGVLDKYGGAAFLNPDQTIFVPMNTVEKMLGVKDWSGILLLAESPNIVDEVSNRIRSMYGGNLDVISFLAIARIASSIVSAVNFITFAATLSAFAVAVAGTASTMITSVVERTREIGVMKALGFKDTQVLALIIMEGVTMSIIGCAIGVLVGFIGAHLLSTHGLVISSGEAFTMSIQASPKITVELMAETILLTILTGILGSIFPAYRAMKIPPAVALRYE
ncbi:predicted ABC transporter [Desulfurococcus amylolyticus 1221n]|uniref:Predicted ABC transporter n=1 Tax=Desulfurococcus amylolyticus (strain DSM 18924 / JCM 16383 / VKM B-2413 / 1221n) TaxID=490899 RepID=B8D3Y8_DESA1|nr:ABC transporter permease [Desulfurococcus amylolyticus]ACL10819.1 predicted ABC transporter [Desulfurococcus amylolyticus 1221n]